MLFRIVQWPGVNHENNVPRRKNVDHLNVAPVSSLPGNKKFALSLGLRERTTRVVHHEFRFPGCNVMSRNVLYVPLVPAKFVFH